MTATTSRWLEGNFAPVTDEVTLTDLPVTGRIPEHLDGRYVRNGPNPFATPDPASYHWFSGDGMLHGVRIRDGKATWYRNRWVRSRALAEAMGEAPRPGTPFGDFDFSANTNVIAHAGKTLAIVEAGSRPYEVDDELETVRICDFDGTLPGGYTAHPKFDPATGELHAVSYFWGWGNKVQYSVVGPDGRVSKTVDVEFGASPMVHDCSLTESSVLLYDLPVVFDVDMAMSGAGLPYRWDPDYQPRVGVLPRDGDADDVGWFDVEPCFVFHPMNAYDEGDRIVVDLCRHERVFDRDRLGPSEGAPTLDRWTIDRSAGKVIEERIDDRDQDFPRVDERLTGRRHRYGYSVGGGVLYKHDFAEGTTQTRSMADERGLGEFVFVPSSTDGDEDDGVLMGFTFDPSTETSNLTFLDAATLDDVAAVRLPVRVPYGFHGNWLPARS